MERDDIIIRNAVVHILDSYVGMPVLSDALLELSPDLNDFLRDHIYRIASGDDLKKCSFQTGESAVYQMLADFNEENLLPVSRQIAEYLYSIMNSNIEIPAADLLIVTYQALGERYLALLKMNYKEFYVHYTLPANQDDPDGISGNCNDIIKQTAALPASSSKLSEAALINLSDYAVALIEKKYDVNGVKTNYFSQMFLQCQTSLSSKAKLDIVTKAVNQIHQKYYEDDFDKKMEAKSIIHSDIEEQGAIEIETIGERLFGTEPEIKEEFTEKLEKYNLVKEEVKPQNKQTTKKFEKQFLVTDTGIEINIPMEQYNNKQNLEFITNPDGTISVLIKNINRLTAK
ncbi:MAG: nucleoid-associated protein [Lachnospiraceae bacterium]|nr:nucleoid-associated protein [Lachnospiraceae bacterium]